MIIGILTLASILAAASTRAAGLRFPSEHAEYQDPSRRYVVLWEEAAKKSPHRLYLKNISTGAVIRVIEFTRHVDVLWSPSGNHLAVTDFGGSDFSKVFVSESAKPNAIDMADVMAAQLGKIDEISGNHHVYYEALEWIDSHTLRFKVHGYGEHDKGEFELGFTYDVKGTVKRSKIDG